MALEGQSEKMDVVQLSGKRVSFGLQANGLSQTVHDRLQHFMLDYHLFGNAVVSHFLSSDSKDDFIHNIKDAAGVELPQAAALHGLIGFGVDPVSQFPFACLGVHPFVVTGMGNGCCPYPSKEKKNGNSLRETLETLLEQGP